MDFGIGEMLAMAMASMAEAGAAEAGMAGLAAAGDAAIGSAAIAGGSMAVEGGAAAASAAAAGWSASDYLMAGSLATSAAGTVTSAAGAAAQGAAARRAAEYNAQVAALNAEQAKQNAIRAGQAGEAQVAMKQQKTRATVGSIMANQAAGGIDVNSGSALDVRSSAAALGELDAINIRAEAARTAYGYNVTSASQTGQAALDKATGENAALAGDITAGSTLLGGAGSAGSKFAQYQQSGGFTG